jgi:hypothetical protein
MLLVSVRGVSGPERELVLSAHCEPLIPTPVRLADYVTVTDAKLDSDPRFIDLSPSTCERVPAHIRDI